MLLHILLPSSVGPRQGPQSGHVGPRQGPQSGHDKGRNLAKMSSVGPRQGPQSGQNVKCRTTPRAVIWPKCGLSAIRATYIPATLSRNRPTLTPNPNPNPNPNASPSCGRDPNIKPDPHPEAYPTTPAGADTHCPERRNVAGPTIPLSLLTLSLAWSVDAAGPTPSLALSPSLLRSLLQTPADSS